MNEEIRDEVHASIRNRYEEEYKDRAWMQYMNTAIHNGGGDRFSEAMLRACVGRPVIISVITVNTVKKQEVKDFEGRFKGVIDSYWEKKVEFVCDDGAKKILQFQHVVGFTDKRTGKKWCRGAKSLV